MGIVKVFQMSTVSDIKSQYWRLNNLYFIKDKQGRKVKFRFNWAQEALYSGMWYLNIVLKARQLGMTTFIQMFMLDTCLFNSNVNSGVIAHTRDDAQKFFKDKIKFAYDNLPQAIRDERPATNDSAGELMFSNGSSIRVGTSLRSGTLQYLHVSEFGKVCAKFPDKAEEIITGALNTVAAGQFVYIESTAEGDYGHFYDMCMQCLSDIGEELTELDYKLFFFPWYEHPGYRIDASIQIPQDLETYFEELESQDIKLDSKQKAWYSKKRATQKGKMKQEYPSTCSEAFEQVSEFAVYGEEIGSVIEDGRRITLPVSSKPVDIFFDIGKSTKAETTCVWFMQHNDPWHDFIDYYQNQLRPVGTYISEIRSKGYNIRSWYIPHDADQKDYSMETFKTRMISAGVAENDIIVVPRVDRVSTGIDKMKGLFSSCRFDDIKTAAGWKALKAYKYAWNERKAVMGEPVHDWASHPSDAIRQFAQGYSGELESEITSLPYRGWQ